MSTQTRTRFQQIIASVARHEREFGRPLPTNSFYKIVARLAAKRLKEQPQ